MKTEAIIFDMDGVISDTQKLHSTVECAILAEHGIPLDPDECARRFAGVSDNEFLTQVAGEAGKPIPDFEEFARRKYGRMLAPQEGDITEIPGTRACIELLHERGIPLAVASGSTMRFIELVIGTLGLKSYFKTLVSTDEVSRGKPAPDIFLLAAERLGVAPDTCIVIEDGINGLVAARAAGMKTIGLLTHLKAEECPADIIVSNLEEVDWKAIGL